jgi:hypothetical protein
LYIRGGAAVGRRDASPDGATGGVPSRCEPLLAQPLVYSCDIWGWSFEGKWRERLPLLEGDAAQCFEEDMPQRNLYVAYPDYRGHEGCTILLGVACLNGWLILNDDPADPVALRPFEGRCEGCSADAPCTHVLNSTLGVMWDLPGCAFHLPCGDWPLSVDAETSGAKTTPAARIVVESGEARLATGGADCTCECSGLARCTEPAGAPTKLWAPLTSFTTHIPEAEPLAVADPKSYTPDVPAIVDGPGAVDAHAACLVARCAALSASW